MHPDLQRALAKARHEDLLCTYPSRGQPIVHLEEKSPRFYRSRRRLGSMLIRTGARLGGDRLTPFDLAHE